MLKRDKEKKYKQKGKRKENSTIIQELINSQKGKKEKKRKRKWSD